MFRSLHCRNVLPTATSSSVTPCITRSKFVSISNTPPPLRRVCASESLSSPTTPLSLRFGIPGFRCPVSVGKDQELRIAREEEEGEGDRGFGGQFTDEEQIEGNFKVGIRNPSIGNSIGGLRVGFGDQAFFLFTFIALMVNDSFVLFPLFLCHFLPF